MLLTCFLALVSLWRPVFRQERSFCRAVRQALGSLTVVGTATLTRILAGLGLDQQDWSAEYRLQSRSDWDEQALFDALLPAALAHCGALVHESTGRHSGRWQDREGFSRPSY